MKINNISKTLIYTITVFLLVNCKTTKPASKSKSYVATQNITPDLTLKKEKNDFKLANNFFTYGDSILYKDMGYLAVVDSLEKYSKYINENADPGKKSFFYQTLMTFASFIDNKLAIAYEGKALQRKYGDSPPIKPNLKAQNAIQYIVDNYSNKKIILINEAHSSSQNRAFIRDLIVELSKKGYNLLGIEALDVKDTTLAQSGFPTYSTGFYTKDPVFSQAIRTALKNNMLVFPYDFEKINKEENTLSGFDSREKYQYINIKEQLFKKPDSKVIVWAGHDHIHKSHSNNQKRMGEYFANEYGDEVVSIDCSLMREKHDSTAQHPLFTQVIKKFSTEREPFVLIDSSGAYLSPSLKNKVDFNVFFPKTIYTQNIPNWYFSKTQPEYELKQNLEEGDFIQLYNLNEITKFPKTAIPVFQLKNMETTNILKLNLQSGNYRLRIINTNLQVSEKKIVVP